MTFGFNKTTVNGQQTTDFVHKRATDNSQQTLCTSDACSRTVDRCPLSVDYYESQIRKADSLYKNYLPQYNFDEVKAAMEFFDSYQQSAISSQRWRLFGKEADDENRLIAESRQLTAAKAHYYHAVGLTEKDDIVGACEHYLIALEIMEEMMANGKSLKTKGKKSVDNPEDYEKIRFVVLIYNRLGHLFYNENFCDLAILKYKKALGYVDLINDNSYKANLLKGIGNSFQLDNRLDSALYYYNESLKTSGEINNKLDIEKCIAQVLYGKGEKDSVYIILKENLRKTNSNHVKYSYHFTIGNLYYKDKSYDSALYYLEKSLDNNIITKKIAFTTTLSAIYDSISNYEKKAYYDNFSANLLKKSINKEVDRSKLQVLYNKYNERKTEKENAIAKARTRRNTITISFVVIVVVISALTYIRYNHRKLHDELKNEIDNRTKDLESKNSIISQKEKLINEYQITNDNKDKIIDKQKKEIDRIKTRISKKNVNVEAYYASEICKKIVNRKDNDFSCLK